MNRQEQIQATQYELPYHNIPWLYSWEHQLEYEVYLQHLVHWIQFLKPRNILDVGCGDGRFLREVGYGTGVDLNSTAVKWARAFGVDARHADMKDIAGKFDLVTAIEVLEHVDNEEEFVQELVQRAAKDILIMVPSATLPVSPKHYRHYTSQQLRDLVKPFIYIKAVYPLIYQPKWWAVLESLHFRWMGPWLKKQLRKRLHTKIGQERHLLLWGTPLNED